MESGTTVDKDSDVRDSLSPGQFTASLVVLEISAWKGF